MYNRVRNLLLSLFILMSFSAIKVNAGEPGDATRDFLTEALGEGHTQIRWSPYLLEIEPLAGSRDGNVITMQLRVTGVIACDEVALEYFNPDNLPCAPSVPASYSIATDETVLYQFDVTLPENDTGSVQVIARCKSGAGYGVNFSFVTTGDTLEYHFGQRRQGLRKSHHWRKRRAIYDVDTVSERLRKHPTPPQYGVLDRDGYIHYEGTPEYDSIKQERERNRQPNPYIGDTTVIWVKDSAGVYQPMDKKDFESWDYQRKIDLQWEKIRKLEQSPLEKYDGERFMIGDEAWVRSRGETLFHKVEPVKDIFTDAMRVVDSLRALVPDTAIHISFDLRDPEQYKRVSKLVDSLIPMAKVGFYHGRIKRDSCGQLEKEGLKMGLFPRYPGEKRKYERPKKSKDESRSN